MGKLAILKQLANITTSNGASVHANNKSSKNKVGNILRPKTKAEINDGMKYKDQFKQLNTTLGKSSPLRALSNWALNFFDDEPDIKKIAKAVSQKVDKAIYAVNRPAELKEYLKNKSSILSMIRHFEHSPTLTSKFPFISKKSSDWSFRTKILYQAKQFNKANTSWAVTYRMPMILAAAAISTQEQSGKCEEHAYTSLYLLNIGHMVQNMPYGQLKNDIFYTGAAITGHAITLLVKGKEFKKAILMAKKSTNKSDMNSILAWLVLNTKKWGSNAWIVDGWNTKNVKSISAMNKNLSIDRGTTSKMFSRSFGEKSNKASLSFMARMKGVKAAKSNSSAWDLTIKQMVYRVAKVHGIKIK